MPLTITRKPLNPREMTRIASQSSCTPAGSPGGSRRPPARLTHEIGAPKWLPYSSSAVKIRLSEPDARSATRANAAPARTIAAHAPFMSVEPSPNRRSPSIVGAKGSVRH